MRGAQGAAEVFVIGGAEIFALAEPQASLALVTEIDADFEGEAIGDFDFGDLVGFLNLILELLTAELRRRHLLRVELLLRTEQGRQPTHPKLLILVLSAES
mgnify:CR=1 FL=1